LCAAAGAGRTRAAEGNNRQENFSPLKSDGPHFSFREKSWRAWFSVYASPDLCSRLPQS